MSANSVAIARYAKHFMSGTMLSRISGLARDMTMASLFGVSPAVAAFLVAFRFSNLLRRLFGEGALMNGVVPHYESLNAKDPKNGALFFRDLLWSFGIVLACVIGFLELLLASLLSTGLSFGNAEIIRLTMLMLPGLFGVCYYSLFSAVLQCSERFFLPAIAPVFFNSTWIIAMVYVRNWPVEKAMLGLSYATLFAFGFQLISVMIPSMRILSRHLSLRNWFQISLFSPEVRAMLGKLTLVVIGVGAVQINGAFDAICARYASLEGPAFLTYAIRLYQLPLSLFAISVASALLPSLVRNSSQKIQQSTLLSYGLYRSFQVLFPLTFALFLLGESAVACIYGHGEFSAFDVKQTALCLNAYGLGLVPASFVVILAQAYYSQNDYKTSTKCSLISVGMNAVLNGVMVLFLGWGAMSVAFATSISAGVNCLLLFSHLNFQVQWCGYLKVIVATFCTYFMVSFLMQWVSFSSPLLHLIFFGSCFSSALYVAGVWRSVEDDSYQSA